MVHPNVDALKFFQGDLMHGFSYGISLLIKNSLGKLLRDKRQTTLVILIKKVQNNHFQVNSKNTLLRQQPVIKKHFQRQSVGSVLREDFSRRSKPYTLHKLYIGVGIVGTLEAKD